MNLDKWPEKYLFNKKIFIKKNFKTSLQYHKKKLKLTS